MNFLKSFSFRKLLYNRRFTIPLSIFLSFILWMTITVNQKPTMERSFSDMTVAINMEDTFASENDMSIVSDISSQKFTVIVRGPNYLVSTLSSNEINLYASAAAVDSPGEYDLTVAATQATASAEYEILSITPKTVKVNFDYIETQEFTIEALAEGATASEGLIAEAAVVSGTESNTITITGPRTVVNSIETVQAKTTVDRTLAVSETFDASIVLYDEKGKEIDTENLTLSADKVKVTVPISKKKTVPVKVDFSNVPNGFDKSSISAKIDHSEVTIIGTPETVDKTKQITLSPIDITTLNTDSKSFDVSPKLPEGVRLLDAIDHFVVTVDMSGYAEDTITVSKVKYSGLTGNLKTSGTETIKNVKICGPASVINSIKASKAYAQINLSDKKAGEHTVNAVISFEGYDNVWAIGTYKTSVTIK